jgi:hypothetical protein
MAQPSKAAVKALTDPWAWDRASPDVRSECFDHIYDAIKQVQDAPDVDARRVMLGRLPPHVRDMVAAWVKAMWGGVTCYFATDASPEGRRDAVAWASDHGGAVHVVEGLNLTMVTKKAP